jgi:hypothetical protein
MKFRSLLSTACAFTLLAAAVPANAGPHGQQSVGFQGGGPHVGGQHGVGGDWGFQFH